MTNCIVCGSDDTVPYLRTLLQCSNCNFVFADLNLTDEQFAALYSKNYFFGEEYIDYLTDRKVITKNFELRWNVLRKYVNPQFHQRLFEIGCAYGFFLDLVRNSFNSVEGIDVTSNGIQFAREKLNLNVFCGDLLNHDLDQRNFDVVCLWDTIEHLHRPDLYIQKISHHMNSGALLTITTGDIESRNARWNGEKWRLIHPPTHAYYFSKSTIARLLDRNGFDVLYNQYCGFYRSINNMAYGIFVLRKRMEWIYKLLRASRINQLSVYLNLYDIMYVIARKR